MNEKGRPKYFVEWDFKNGKCLDLYLFQTADVLS